MGYYQVQMIQLVRFTPDISYWVSTRVRPLWTLFLNKYFCYYGSPTGMTYMQHVTPALYMSLQRVTRRHIRVIYCSSIQYTYALRWRHNGCEGVSNHQPHDCLLNRLFRRRSTKTWKLRVNGLCAGNSPVICEFLAQRASNAENVSIWWRHHGINSNVHGKM